MPVQSLLPFIIHYSPSSFTTTFHHSLLPFNNHYHPSSCTASFPPSLLLFIIHHYSSSFTTTLLHSLLISSWTSTLQWSLLPFTNYYYTSAFTGSAKGPKPVVMRWSERVLPYHSLLTSSIYYYPLSFTTTLHHALLPFNSHHSLLPVKNNYCPSAFSIHLHYQ